MDRDYKLIKTKEAVPEGLKPHEKKVLDGIFKSGEEVEISDLRNKFYKELPGIKNIRRAGNRRLLPRGPGGEVKGIYKWVRYSALIVGFALFTNFLLKISIALSGVIILAWSGFMPRKTKQGALANEELLGFREFIDKAEKNRIEALAKDDPTLFDRVLPFALVFGLEEKWADAFKDIYREPPGWYSSPGYNNSFTPRIFAADIGRSLRVMSVRVRTEEIGGRTRRGGSGGRWLRRRRRRIVVEEHCKNIKEEIPPYPPFPKGGLKTKEQRCVEAVSCGSQSSARSSLILVSIVLYARSASGLSSLL
ncbi:MAG: DUF2207 domain-containing protein [Thermodesulfobacteriota bacterium]